MNPNIEKSADAFAVYKLYSKGYFNSLEEARSWYLQADIVAFNGLTPKKVVEEFGSAGLSSLLEYLEDKSSGSFE